MTKPILDTFHLYFKWSCEALPAEEIYSFDTMQREVSDSCRPPKTARYAEVWDSELARAHEAGIRFGRLMRKKRLSSSLNPD